MAHGVHAGEAPGIHHRITMVLGRGCFIALLGILALAPQITSNLFEYPAVNNGWVCLVLCALFLLVLLDFSHLCRMFNLDLLVLVSPVVVLLSYDVRHPGTVSLIYPPLVYVAVRMIVIARIGRSSEAPEEKSEPRSWLPTSWLAVGIVVLAAVHVHWALENPSTSDVGHAGAQGALRIWHGENLYGRTTPKTAPDPHQDTYGPLNYEAYVPFVAVVDETTAARLASLFFSLLTAALLFALGRRVRGPTFATLLAFSWLAYPFTLYADGFDFNDTLVAATLIGALLVAASPVRRGVTIAMAAWTKLSPLVLVPLMITHQPAGGESRLRTALSFAVGFLLASILIFVPALDHNSVGTFITRTFGFQASRSPAFSIWALFDNGYHYAGWVVVTSKILHGLLTALTIGFAVALARLPRRSDVVGLAAASATILIAVQACDGYYSVSYVLWFVPLALVALTLHRDAPLNPKLGDVLEAKDGKLPTYLTGQSVRSRPAALSSLRLR